ncbi:C2H2-type zinc finger protein [Pseudomonas sp. RC10]|uniref:C2H2-type zinc finger protein n=1 Tax=Pseudomonas bambusae TaxID=3139142 RepID=UPI00313988ED
MSSALHAHTPTLTALEPRGLTVRSVRWYRAESEVEAEAQVSQSRLDAWGRVVEQRDARLFASAAARPRVCKNVMSDDEARQKQAKKRSLGVLNEHFSPVFNAASSSAVVFTQSGPNLATVHSLSGNTLKSDSADAGWHVALNNEDGSTAERRDSRATYTRYEYDVLRRVMAVFEASGGAGERCVERFIYGDDQADSSYNLRRQMLRHDDPAGTRHLHAYDLNGLPQLERQRFLESLELPDWPADNDARDALLESGDGFLSRWEYSPWGEQVGMTDAAGNHHQQRFDVAGRLMVSTLQPSGQETSAALVEQIRYNVFDQVQSQVAGNGLITETTYDPADGRLSRSLCKPANDAKALQDISYFYDPLGNVVRHEDHSIESRYHSNRRIDPVSTFRYDSLYQLIEASGRERLGAGRGPELPGVIDFSGNDESLIGTYTRHYQYDAGGNLLLMQHQGQNGQAHRLRMAVSNLSNKSIPWREGLSDEQIENTFDANGNLNQLQLGQTLHWDLRNQLAQVTLIERENNQSDAERYIYGGGGRRLRKYANRHASGVMHHAETRYLPGLELHEDSATGQRRQVVNINAGRGKIRWMHWLSTPPAGLPENSLYYGFDNQLGSVTLETDEHGQVASREEYYPFGSTAMIASRNEVEVSFKTLRYSGKERDATGLYDYGYRYLAPWLCRWLNPDPAGNIDGLNLYGFVGNNPVTRVDGDGRMWEPADTGDPPRPSRSLSVASFDTEMFGSPLPSPASVVTELFNSAPPSPASIVMEMFDSPLASPAPVATTQEVDRSSGSDDQAFRRPAIPGPSVRATGSQWGGWTAIPGPAGASYRVIDASRSAVPGRSGNGQTRNRKYGCENCEKSFATPSLLQRHLRTHTGEKPYRCEVCEKSFSLLYLLQRHQQSHTGEKPHRCDICEQSFSQSAHLLRHRRIHTGERQHVCVDCNKSFHDSSALKTHRRRHTGEFPYVCPVCAKGYSTKANLHYHQGRHDHQARS